MISRFNILLCVTGILFLVGCAINSGETLRLFSQAQAIGSKAGLLPSVIQTPGFQLQSFSRVTAPGQPLTVYIEGDGLAWISKNRISADPTPLHPIALELAVLDPAPNVVYLARPCQYITEPGCSDLYWSSARFSEKVILSMNAAVEQYKAMAQAPTVDLRGFSGGGAVVLLIAERRKDVSSIITVAGNLDPDALNRYHKVSPLAESLDPLTDAAKIAGIPQWHFVGNNDKVVPLFVAENYNKALGSPENIHLMVIDHASHMEGWIERWKDLLSSTR